MGSTWPELSIAPPSRCHGPTALQAGRVPAGVPHTEPPHSPRQLAVPGGGGSPPFWGAFSFPPLF